MESLVKIVSFYISHSSWSLVWVEYTFFIFIFFILVYFSAHEFSIVNSFRQLRHDAGGFSYKSMRTLRELFPLINFGCKCCQRRSWVFTRAYEPSGFKVLIKEACKLQVPRFDLLPTTLPLFGVLTVFIILKTNLSIGWILCFDGLGFGYLPSPTDQNSSSPVKGESKHWFSQLVIRSLRKRISYRYCFQIKRSHWKANEPFVSSICLLTRRHDQQSLPIVIFCGIATCKAEKESCMQKKITPQPHVLSAASLYVDQQLSSSFWQELVPHLTAHSHQLTKLTSNFLGSTNPKQPSTFFGQNPDIVARVNSR